MRTMESAPRGVRAKLAEYFASRAHLRKMLDAERTRRDRITLDSVRQIREKELMMANLRGDAFMLLSEARQYCPPDLAQAIEQFLPELTPRVFHRGR